MADIQVLKRNYRRLAKIEAGEDLNAQVAYLNRLFVARAKDADEGGFQATNDSFEGASFAGLWKGSSAEDRTAAIDLALQELEAEIEAKNAGDDAPGPIGCLLPRVITAPR